MDHFISHYEANDVFVDTLYLFFGGGGGGDEFVRPSVTLHNLPIELEKQKLFTWDDPKFTYINTKYEMNWEKQL